MGIAFQKWCRQVTDQVRFKPDRAAIEKELTAHYEDHVRDLERLDYPRDLARQRALAAMGDAEEVGRALDKVHKPWLGWLWRVSRAVLIVLAVTVVSAAWFLDGAVTVYERFQGERQWEDPPAAASRAVLSHGELWAAPGETMMRDGQYQAELELWLETDSPTVIPDGLFSGLELADSHGALPYWDVRMPEQDSWRYAWGQGCDFYGWTRHHRTVKLLLDHPPEWAEITYSYGDNRWTLRVEWEETP